MFRRGPPFTESLIAAEVAALNNVLSLPETLTITVEPCDEANAFYDLDIKSIIICTELDPHLRKIGAD